MAPHAPGDVDTPQVPPARLDYVGEETQRRIASMRRFNGWLVRQLRPYLGTTVIEVGCGLGNVTELLVAAGHRVIALDCYPPAVDAVQERFPPEQVEVVMADVTDPSCTALRERGADSVAALSVLEHVEDDAAALRHMAGMLSSGGVLAVYVPALPSLYGSLDQHLGHHRRYRMRELSRKLGEAGLAVEHLRYLNLFGVLGWFLNARVLRRRILPAGQLSLYDRLLPVFATVERLCGPPIGQNLLGIARKP